MHHLFHIYPIAPAAYETIPPVWHDPAAALPYTTEIAVDRQAAVDAEAECTDVICVYSDGSAHDGGVGAAAVLIRDGRQRTLRYYLGPDTEHTVFEAELVATLLAMELLRTEQRASKATSIAVDNQAAIHALRCTKPWPGHHFAAAFRRAAKTLQGRRGKAFSLRIRWIAGHEGCYGNELADIAAKKAAEGHSSLRASLPAYLCKELPHSVSAEKQARMRLLQVRWAARWREDVTCARLWSLDPQLPKKCFMSLLSKADVLRRAHTSLLFQLRTGHVPLNHYLHRFSKRTDRHPKGCQGYDCADETVYHYLLECPEFQMEREALKKALKICRALRIDHLLTGTKAVVPLM